MAEKLDNKPISIELEVDGELIRYVTPKRISGSLWREAALVSEEIETGDVLIADLDSHLQFVCDVFGNQFDIDTFEKGIDSRDLMKTVYASAIFVMGQVSLASEMLVSSVDLNDINEKKS